MSAGDSGDGHANGQANGHANGHGNGHMNGNGFRHNGITANGASSHVDVALRPIDISLVIPAYNEEGDIELSYEAFKSILDSMHVRWEIIFVDDGSTDLTPLILEAIADKDQRVKLIHHRRNFGRCAALASAFSYVRGMWVATSDADLQQDPKDLIKLWEKAQEGYDFVNGTMTIRRDPISKRLPSRFFNAVVGHLLHTQIRDLNSAMKLFRHDLTHVFLRYGYGEFHRYYTALAILKGYRVGEVKIEGHPRLHGHSKFGFERYLRGALDLINIYFFYGWMERPLHLFGGVAITIFLAALAIFGVGIAGSFSGGEPLTSQPIFTLGVLFSLSSLQLLVMGLIASMIRNLWGGGAADAPKIARVVGIDRRQKVDWRLSREGQPNASGNVYYIPSLGQMSNGDSAGRADRSAQDGG